MISNFYSELELKSMNFKYIGKNVLISKKCSIYGIENISIDDNSRIDDFCILSGNIEVGKYVHISAGCYLFSGKYKIIFEDFSGISSQSSIYALTDDYSGNYMTNATVPDGFRNVLGGDVVLKRHALVGSGSTILPNVVLGEGCAIGAKSLVNKWLPDWSICKGIPATFHKKRSKKTLDVEREFFKSIEEEHNG